MARVSLELCGLFQLLLLLLPGACWSYNVVEGVTGTLAAEEAMHYSVDVTGVLVVALLTEEGDADLYASTVAEKPDYRDSQFASCSCGLDLIVIPTSKGADSQRVYLSVVGHSRNAVSQYQLFIISPTNNDITKYQVWDWDPESGRDVLLVNYDPLQIANDHNLHQLLEQLQLEAAGIMGSGLHKGVWSTIENITEWSLYLSLETLKIMIEILL